MQISYNWLKKYVKLSDTVTARDVAEKLKLSTVEVEGIVDQGAALENIVVGKVLTAEKHPNADKLQVCQVDVGKEKIIIVCGGSNVAAGMLVVVAKNGARVKWHGEGELVTLKPTTIRGVESNGMICGADEVGLVDRFPKKDEKEIVDLSGLKAKPGTPLATALGLDDAIFEIDNKSLSNRPDLWGHYGLAREVAVVMGRDLGRYKTAAIKKGSGINLKVKVEARECPKYTAVALNNIKVAPSPAWLQTALTSVGVRPINNIVDATNFVMLDLGQPLHAFDAAKVADHTIVVRFAEPGESVVLLDDQERSFTDDMLVIASPERALALAGIMGCDWGSITDETTSIILESANFDATNIRRTSTHLGLRTDASARFEKSLDPFLCSTALARLVEVILEVSPKAKVASSVVDVGKPTLFTGPLTIPTAFFEKKIGAAIPIKVITQILTNLGFGVREKKGVLTIIIPTWRATKDISRSEDIVEEVIRIFGYDQIPSTLPTFSITPPPANALRLFERDVAALLVKEFAYTEVYNYSFVSERQISRMGETAENYLELDNPLSKEKPYLRRCLLLNLLENIEKNLPLHPELRLMEIGKVFQPEHVGLRAETKSDELLPRQDTYLTAVYACKKDHTPFVEMRRIVEALARLVPGLTIAAPTETRIGRHPGRSADVLYRGSTAGSVYELHPQVADQYGIDARVGVVKLDLSAVATDDLKKNTNNMLKLSPFPSVKRDVALVVANTVTNRDIMSHLLKVDPLLTDVELFDVYRGATLGSDLKSLAYHLTYNSSERTLTISEVDVIQDKVEKMLVKNFQAEIRK